MVRFLEQAVNQKSLMWLGHVLPLSTERMVSCMLLCDSGNCRKMVRGDQSMTWEKSMKTLTIGLNCVRAIRLLGWGLRDPRNKSWRQWWYGSAPQSVASLNSKPFFFRLVLQVTNFQLVFHSSSFPFPVFSRWCCEVATKTNPRWWWAYDFKKKTEVTVTYDDGIN